MLKSAGFSLASKLVMAACNFGTMVLISRYLGTEQRGICGWYLVVIAISLVFSELAVGAGAGVLLQKYSLAGIKMLGYIWSFFSSLIVISFFWGLGKINGMEWGLLWLLSWLNAANTLHLTMLLARQRFVLYNGLNIFLSFFTFFLFFLFVNFGGRSSYVFLYSMVLVWGAGFVIVFVALYQKNTASFAHAWHPQLRKDGFKYGFANQASHLTGLLHSRMVFLLLPGALLGVFSNGLSLAEALLMIPTSMGQILFASILNNKGQKASANKARLLWWLSIGILSATFCVFLFVPDTFFQFIFSKSFSGIKNYFMVLAFGMIFYSGYLVLSYWQSANGFFIKNFYATSVGFFANALLCVALYFTKHLSPLSGAYALSFGFFVIFVYSAFQFCKVNGGYRSLFSPPGIKDLSLVFA